MNIAELVKKILIFRDQRNWKQFHNPKDLALSLTLETSEVLEHFQWKNDKELKDYLKKNKRALGEELADVLYYNLLLSKELKINLEKAFLRKMKINSKKYSVKKSRGKATKYKDI